jgi:hypothetical protein
MAVSGPGRKREESSGTCRFLLTRDGLQAWTSNDGCVTPRPGVIAMGNCVWQAEWRAISSFGVSKDGEQLVLTTGVKAKETTGDMNVYSKEAERLLDAVVDMAKRLAAELKAEQSGAKAEARQQAKAEAEVELEQRRRWNSSLEAAAEAEARAGAGARAAVGILRSPELNRGAAPRELHTTPASSRRPPRPSPARAALRAGGGAEPSSPPLSAARVCPHSRAARFCRITWSLIFVCCRCCASVYGTHSGDRQEVRLLRASVMICAHRTETRNSLWLLTAFSLGFGFQDGFSLAHTT